ncbi:MAG: flippase [Candidatus Paceibacterota bacterium]
MIQKVKSFLFDNNSTKQTIIKNTFWYSISQFAAIAIKSFFVIWVARYFSIEEYGRFNIASSFASMFVILADFGTSQILMREISQGKADQKRVDYFFTIKVLLVIFSILVTFGCSFLLGADWFLLRAIWIFALYTGLYAFLGFFYYYFMAKNRMEYLGWGDTCVSAITVIAGIFVIKYHPTTSGLALAYLLAITVVSIVFLMFFITKIQPLRISFDKEQILNILRISLPLAAVSFFAIIYNNIDSTILGFYRKYLEAGYYNSALKIIAVSIMPAGLIASVFAPHVNRLFQESKESLKKILDAETETMIFLAIGILFGGWALAPNLMGAAYGAKYYLAVPALRLLLFTSIVFYFLQPFSQVLIASHNEKKVLYPYIVIAALNVILDLFLVPKYGFMGTAIASVIALNSGLFVMVFWAHRERLINFSYSFICRAIFCAIVSSLCIEPMVALSLKVSDNIFFLVFAGGCSYAISYVILRFVFLRNIIKE